MDLYLTLAIILIGVFLFVKDYFSIDTTSIIIMALFIVAGVLSPEEGFSGFNHPATLTLGCIFVVSGGIFNSGVLNGLNDHIIKLAKIHYVVALMVFCFITALFSAFINDTAVVALMLPIALTVCRETNISPGKLLIPISFAALFGGTCTLIGTSTNILVSSYAKKYGLEEFGMFEFSAAAFCLLVVGFLYIFFIAPFLLPKNKEESDELTKKVEKYVIEIVIEEGCTDIDRTIVESKLVSEYKVNIMSIMRDGILNYKLGPRTVILKGDILKVVLPPQMVHKLLDVKGYKIKGSKLINTTDNYNVYEVIIPFGSSLSEGSLKSMRFNRTYNMSVLAIRKRGETMYDKLSSVKLMEGDMLLVLGQKEDIKNLEAQKLVVTLSEYQKQRVDLKKAIPAVLIGIGVVLAASLGLTNILISAMVGALLMIVAKILSPVEAYNAVEWKVIFMMAGVLSMGTALEKTGGDQLIADFIQNTLGQYSPHITLSLLYLITFISTN